MNSMLKSLYLSIVLLMGWANFSCTIVHKRNLPEEMEVSIQKDQKEIEKLRKNIPPDIREENDELKE
ncbi:MAG: hypothetical protein D6797_02125, partial [Bdellovibrio sp.]